MSHQTPTLVSEPREKLGTRYTQRLRAAGRVPAVVYGHGQDPVHVSFDGRAFKDAVQPGAHLFDITAGKETEHCLLKAVQWDYLGREILHADFTRVDLSEKVEVDVEIELVGEAKQVTGSSLDHPVTHVTVSCRADQIPDTIAVSISELTPDAPIHVSDIEAPAGSEIVSDGDGIIAQLSVVKVVEETEEAGDAEPEVIGAKTEEAGGEG